MEIDSITQKPHNRQPQFNSIYYLYYMYYIIYDTTYGLVWLVEKPAGFHPWIKNTVHSLTNSFKFIQIPLNSSQRTGLYYLALK